MYKIIQYKMWLHLPNLNTIGNRNLPFKRAIEYRHSKHQPIVVRSQPNVSVFGDNHLLFNSLPTKKKSYKLFFKKTINKCLLHLRARHDVQTAAFRWYVEKPFRSANERRPVPISLSTIARWPCDRLAPNATTSGHGLLMSSYDRSWPFRPRESPFCDHRYPTAELWSGRPCLKGHRSSAFWIYSGIVGWSNNTKLLLNIILKSTFKCIHNSSPSAHRLSRIS